MLTVPLYGCASRGELEPLATISSHPLSGNRRGRRSSGLQSLKEFVFVVMCAADSEDVAARNAGDVNAMIGWTDALWP